MKRASVKLPDDLDARLRHEAALRCTTISAITREALEAHLGHGGPRPLLAAGAGRSGQAHIAERIAELVWTYRSLPLGTVDASLITAAERLDITEVAMLDRRHFSVVRPAHARFFGLLP